MSSTVNRRKLIKQVLTGSAALATGGVTAAGATSTGNPVRQGAIGKTANPTAVTDGQVANIVTI